jgi:succinate--hydroxymethylglutarate CoA-transferase
VLDARATEKSRDLDVSLFDRSLQNLSYLATWYLSDGHVQGREPRSGHPSLIGSQLYRRRDGFIFIMCNKEKFWPILCDRIGRPEWARGPRFRTFKDRLDNRALLNKLLDAALSARSAAKRLDHFAGHVPAVPVNDIRAALDSPFVRQPTAYVTISDPARRRCAWSPAPL